LQIEGAEVGENLAEFRVGSMGGISCGGLADDNPAPDGVGTPFNDLRRTAAAAR